MVESAGDNYSAQSSRFLSCSVSQIYLIQEVATLKPYFPVLLHGF